MTRMRTCGEERGAVAARKAYACLRWQVPAQGTLDDAIRRADAVLTHEEERETEVRGVAPRDLSVHDGWLGASHS